VNSGLRGAVTAAIILRSGWRGDERMLPLYHRLEAAGGSVWIDRNDIYGWFNGDLDISEAPVR